MLSYDDKQKLACATHLKISPDRIYYIGSETDGSGHFTGLHVNSTFISIERYIGWWVRLALPREMTDEIQAFIDKRRKRTA